MNGQNRIVTTCQHDKIPGVFESSVRKPQVNASIVSPSVPGAVEADRTSNETPNKTNNHCPWSQHIDSWRQLAGSEIGRRSYVPLPNDCIDELDNALAQGFSADNNRDELLYSLPACAALVAMLRTELLSGNGFVVLDRLPVKRYDINQNRQLAGLIGSMLSPLLEQDRHGTILYDVLDKGSAEVALRRSKTNQAQPFHTDGAWLQPSPALIGLFCIQPAMSGGSSQLASLPMAIARLAEQDEAFDIAALHQAMFWNKMGEHKAGDQPYSHLPALDSQTGCFRYYVNYVETGYALAGQQFPDVLRKMFHLIDQALAATAIKPFALQAGQLQYVNNQWLVHARAEFTDLEVAERGRHLVRIWNRRP